MNAKLSTRGQLELPVALRRRDHLRAGQTFKVERIDCGEYRLLARALKPNKGLLDWLLACPEKSFFIPVASETTDSLCAIS